MDKDHNLSHNFVLGQELAPTLENNLSTQRGGEGTPFHPMYPLLPTVREAGWGNALWRDV